MALVVSIVYKLGEPRHFVTEYYTKRLGYISKFLLSHFLGQFVWKCILENSRAI